jgi:hypothetical protein
MREIYLGYDIPWEWEEEKDDPRDEYEPDEEDFFKEDEPTELNN